MDFYYVIVASRFHFVKKRRRKDNNVYMPSLLSVGRHIHQPLWSIIETKITRKEDRKDEARHLANQVGHTRAI